MRIGARTTITQADRLANLAGGLHLVAGCRRKMAVRQRKPRPGAGRVAKGGAALAAALWQHQHGRPRGAAPARGKESNDIVDSSTTASLGGFTVELKRSGREFFIPAGRSILEVLLDAGVDVDYSCELGICGTCEQRVISGIPEHRDSVLSEDEQAANTRVMICCAGCKTDRLVLDL
jgi:ferredoxin